MACAFDLTRPELEGRYEVTVYQQGWRLGGKGASGRGAYGRIEEHGLHVWMGFYENAFGLMRDAYEELGRDPSTCPISTIDDAFSPAHEIGVAQPTLQGDWAVWSTVFPPLAGSPGTPLRGTGRDHPFSWQGYFHRATQVMSRLFRLASGLESFDGPSGRGTESLFAAGVGFVDSHVAILQNHLGTIARVLESGLTEPSSALPELTKQIIVALDHVRTRNVRDPHRQRASEVLEVLVVSVVGAIRSGAIVDPEGFDALDCYDFREFLQIYGASDAAVDSPFVRGLYSLMFAYEDGDASRPRTAAGQALRGCLRMFFTYRGSLFWKMAAGMGDVVFAPLYEVLVARGVRFEFFHRLRDVGMSEPDERGARHVASLAFARQARVHGPYAPLVDVEGVPSWPAEPRWDLLVDGQRHRAEGRRFESSEDDRSVEERVLRVERDFDLCVLAVGLGEVPVVCRSILEIDRRWARMVTEVKTVATQAMQLWLREPMSGVGWEKGPVTITAFEPPFDTWADMTHLIERESWPANAMPQSIAYFCNVLDERVIVRGMTTEQADALVERHGRDFVAHQLPALWPGILDERGRVREGALIDPRGGADPLSAQYYRANISRSERYTLSLPGTPQYRISPLDRTYDNLAIAGDWTSCGLNLGCVESAVMSGRLAAHAISGFPALADIVGYDHL